MAEMPLGIFLQGFTNMQTQGASLHRVRENINYVGLKQADEASKQTSATRLGLHLHKLVWQVLFAVDKRALHI